MILVPNNRSNVTSITFDFMLPIDAIFLPIQVNLTWDFFFQYTEKKLREQWQFLFIKIIIISTVKALCFKTVTLMPLMFMSKI